MEEQTITNKSLAKTANVCQTRFNTIKTLAFLITGSLHLMMP